MSQEYFCAFLNFIKGKYVARSPDFPDFQMQFILVSYKLSKFPVFPAHNIITFINGQEKKKKSKKGKKK